ncbi:AAA family ATPase [Chloroflexota bacterium]
MTNYEIRDIEGKLVAVHERRDNPDGSKSMYWRRNGNYGLDDLLTSSLPLYNAHLLKDLPPDSRVIITEGEKAADALNSLNIPSVLAVGTVTGALGTPEEDSFKVLFPFEVYLWPDNDGAGFQHMGRIAGKLRSLDIIPRRIDFPESPPKGDAADAMYMGYKADAILKLLEQAEEYPEITETRGEHTIPSPVTEPLLTIRGGVYEFSWGDFVARLSRLKEHKDGRTSGEIRVTTSLNGYNTTLLQSTINLLSTRSRADLVKTLTEKCDITDWARTIDYICTQTLEALRQDEPAVELWATNDVSPPRYLLSPIIAEKQPNFIYGPGGSGKSYLGLLFGLCIRLPWADNPFGLKVEVKTINVLYLDWETTREEVNWRLKCLKNGLDLPDISIHYRRCTMSLADDLESITETVLNLGSQFIIIDSLAAASGGDLNASDTALRFFRALRTLNTTSLIIAHTPKEGGSIYGSAFFNNYGRSNWEAKQEQHVGERELLVGLFHRKTNLSKLYDPMGFRFRFDDEGTFVERADIKESSLAKDLPLKDRIEKLLKRGAMSAHEIAKELDKQPNSIRVILSRQDGKLFTKIGDKWGCLEKSIS